jgi:hypothetical protein
MLIRFKYSIYPIVLLVLSLGSCGILPKVERPKTYCFLTINFKTKFKQEMEINIPILEIYFLKKNYLFSKRIPNKMNALFDEISIQELSKYNVLALRTYNLMLNNTIKYIIEIDKDFVIAILVYKNYGKILSKKIVNIDYKKLNVLNIELIEKAIKIRNEE